MIYFLYQAHDLKGEPYFSLATSRHKARQQLNDMAELPVFNIRLKQIFLHSPFRRQDLIFITQQLATLLRAGLTLMDSLTLLQKENKSVTWRWLLGDLIQSLTKGVRFSDALNAHPTVFPFIYREIITISETTGSLEYGLTQLAAQFEEQEDLKKRIKKAMRYPLFLASMTVIAVVIMLLFVLPRFSSIYLSFDAELPAITQAVMALSDGLQQHAFALFVTAMLLFIIAHIFKKKLPTHYEWLLFKLPFVAIIVKTGALTSFFKTIALTQSHTMPLPQALQSTLKAMPSLKMQHAIYEIKQTIETGVPLSEAIAMHPFFPPICRQLIHIGEACGTLDAMLHQLADYYAEQNRSCSDAFSKWIEPFFMTCIAGLIGTFIIAIYLPIFGLGEVF